MGIVSPVGIDVSASWANILAARSGIATITRFDASAFPSRIAGEVKDFDVTQYLSGKDARRYDTFVHYGQVATMKQFAMRASRTTRATTSASESASAQASVACR